MSFEYDGELELSLLLLLAFKQYDIKEEGIGFYIYLRK
jgi:hypothetical protein